MLIPALRRAWLLAAALLSAVALWTVPPAGAVPAAIVSYASTPDARVDAYARPGNVIVVTMDMRVRDPARILRWRSKGAGMPPW